MRNNKLQFIARREAAVRREFLLMTNTADTDCLERVRDSHRLRFTEEVKQKSDKPAMSVFDAAMGKGMTFSAASFLAL